MLKKIMLAALAAFVVGSVGFAVEAVPGLSKPGTLVVGLDDTFAPMGFRDPAGELVGFDIDLARAVAKEMGLAIEFQPVEWSAKEMELAAKNVDCLWNGMSRTPEREKSMTLSKDYLNNRLIIMTVKGVAINQLDELANYRVGTQAGSSGYDVLSQSGVFPLLKDKLFEYATYDECILDMRAGRVDAMVVDEVLGQYKNNNMHAALDVAAADFGDDFYVIGFRRDADNAVNEALRKSVEDAIQRVIDSGEGGKISEKWFGANLLLPMNK